MGLDINKLRFSKLHVMAQMLHARTHRLSIAELTRHYCNKIWGVKCSHALDSSPCIYIYIYLHIPDSFIMKIHLK